MKPIFKIVQLKLSSCIQLILRSVAMVFNFEQIIMYLFIGAVQYGCTVFHDRSYQSEIPSRRKIEIKKKN